MPTQAGKRFLITGANSGVGYAAALQLARHGATVILACRDKLRGEQALHRLRREAKGPESAAEQAEVVSLDLASLDSIHSLANVQNSLNKPLNGLINNAGVMAPPRRLETKEGFELQFGTNVLGHFALTCELMPALDRTPGSRIVTLSSVGHKRGRLNIEDPQSLERYRPLKAYYQSKLADLMFAFELERRLRAGQHTPISIAVHPGVAQTNLFRFGNSRGLFRVMERALAWTIGRVLNSDSNGALPTLYAATAPDAAGGAYYGPQGFQELRGRNIGMAQIAPQANDRKAQRWLWNLCETATQCTLDPAKVLI